MSEKTLTIKGLQIRGDTSTNFTSKNPVLMDRELVYETDTRKFKIGDGSTNYENLKYLFTEKVDKYVAYKSYSGDYMYNSTTNGNCTGYDREFAQVVANDWNKPWFVKFIIKTDMFYNNTTHYPTFHEVLIGCDNVSGTTWVRNFNVIKSTSSRSAHYINVYRPQSATKAESAPFRLNFRAGDQSSKTAHPRSYDVYLVEAVNCTCTLNDELDNQVFQKWYYNDHSTNAYYWSATSGGTFYSTNFDIATNGLQETGDSDTYAYNVSPYFRYVKAGTNGIKRYTILMQDKDGNYQSIVNEDNNYSSSLNKTANTSQFRINTQLFYYNSSSPVSAGNRVSAGTLRMLFNQVDMRYSLNIYNNAASCLPAYASLYLKGTIDSEGYFKLDTTKWWATEEPTEEDGYVYIYIGMVYPDSSPYRVSIEFTSTSNAYWFKNGSFVPYYSIFVSDSSTENLSTVAITGSYNDLIDKPTIPTVNNGTLTIQKNGTQVATFTANQSGNATANITVPTKVSELTNDSGFTTATGHNHDDRYYTESEVDTKLSDKANDNSVVHIANAETITGIKTLSDVNGLKFSANNTSNIYVADAKVATCVPWASDFWHDHFAFLRQHSIFSKSKTSNGTNWVNSDIDIKGLFIQKEADAVTILTKDDLGFRFTLYSNGMFHVPGIFWFELGVSYTATFSSFSISIECSDGKNESGTIVSDEDSMVWSILHNSSITGNSKPYFLYTPTNMINQKYLRFTFIKTTNLDIGSVALTCIKGLTYRKGNQGLGSENQYPYSWDKEANVLPIENNTKNLGSSTAKWNTVYATTFDGNATTSTTASKLGTSTVGSTTQAIYLNAGTPTAITNQSFANELITSLPTWTANPTDNTYFIRQDTGGSNQYGRVKASTFYGYVKGKLDDVYQPKGSYLTEVSWNDVTSKPSFFSGSYDDLTNKPTIPIVTDTYSSTSSNAMSGKAVASAISGLGGVGNYVPTTRKVNNKELSSDITLTSEDIGALSSSYTTLDATKLSGTIPTSCYTDTVTTTTTTGSGNAVTSITADENGVLTVTKDSTFATTSALRDRVSKLGDTMTGSLEVNTFGYGTYSITGGTFNFYNTYDKTAFRVSKDTRSTSSPPFIPLIGYGYMSYPDEGSDSWINTSDLLFGPAWEVDSRTGSPKVKDNGNSITLKLVSSNTLPGSSLDKTDLFIKIQDYTTYGADGDIYHREFLLSHNPPSNSNDTSIATTSWVKSLEYTSNSSFIALKTAFDSLGLYIDEDGDICQREDI